MSGLHVDLSDVINYLDNNSTNYNGLNGNKNPSLFLLFAEECGWILEVEEAHLQNVLNEFKTANVPAHVIGTSVGFGKKSKIEITCNEKTLIESTTLDALKMWERTSFEIEKLQMNPECAVEEFMSFENRTGPKYNLSFNPDEVAVIKPISSPIRVAVIREEGINGDREMIACLIKANFEVHDVTMTDLLSRKTSLDQYRGVVFPGGFSYADTLGSAKGWAASIMCSEILAPQFHSFKKRQDTFSLGVCNGCQLMSLIGWVGEDSDNKNQEAPKLIDVPNVALLHNKSGRFECRWVSLKIEESNAIMLRRMAGSVLGCWTAHGEGRYSFESDNILNDLKASNCITVRYVDDQQNPTETYPMNPNGSVEGIAGLCSKDGRHLAMMPHPERCSEMILWPYIPPNFDCQKCPWQSMFDEAYAWCSENQN